MAWIFGYWSIISSLCSTPGFPDFNSELILQKCYLYLDQRKNILFDSFSFGTVGEIGEIGCTVSGEKSASANSIQCPMAYSRNNFPLFGLSQPHLAYFQSFFTFLLFRRICAHRFSRESMSLHFSNVRFPRLGFEGYRWAWFGALSPNSPLSV